MTATALWRGFASAAIDLLYPPHCPGCASPRERPATGLTLCGPCLAELWPCEEPCCQVCGEPFLPAGAPPFVCQTCTGRRFAFDYAVAPYQSRGVLRELIHRFKYQRQLFLRPVLGELLAPVLDHPRLRALPPGWVSVPVPLHPRRYREREFNQSVELCRELRKRRGIQTLDVLRRTRYTSSQIRFRRDRRMANLRGAFVAKRGKAARLPGQTVALVDDVFTTGSTAHECARVLRSAGAKKVVVITLARG